MIDFKLDQKCGVPFFKQIIDQIRFGIAAGNLLAGEQLPTVRALAVQLKINLNTVTKAYKELEILNMLETQQGTGTSVSTAPIKINPKESKDKLTAICSEYLGIARSYGFSIDEIIDELKKLKGELK